MRTMAHPRKSHDHVSTNKAVSSLDNDKSTGVDPIDPSALGFTKVAYAVDETLELLSIGRCACRKSNPDIFVVQSAEDRAAKNTPCPLHGARQRRILV